MPNSVCSSAHMLPLVWQHKDKRRLENLYQTNGPDYFADCCRFVTEKSYVLTSGMNHCEVTPNVSRTVTVSNQSNNDLTSLYHQR